MATANAKVASLLRRYAAVLVLEGADRFKVRAYSRAAETIEGLDADVGKLVAQRENLTELPAIGTAISRTVQEIVETGTMSGLERSIGRLKPELVELATAPALDPKKVLRIYEKLNIKSLDELRHKLETQEIRQIFGTHIEYHVRRGLDDRPRVLLYDAERIAEKVEKYLASMPGVARVAPVGSLRRKDDTVGDLNFLFASASAAPVFKRFSQFGGIQSSEERSKQETLFKLSSGLDISLRWTRLETWGLALLLHTGSARHLEDLQLQADKHKLKLSTSSLSAKGVDTSDEPPIYRALGLRYIEPELREGRGEIEAARRRKLPELVCLADLKGDLHMHTTASDGANSLAEMAAAAEQNGYAYIAITDHSQSLKITNGLTEKRLFQQIRAIDRLNGRLKKLVILKSAEVDILEDGSLDYSNAALKELDLTICSIHSRFGLNRQQQTQRIMRAMDNPYFNILGHATGRLLLKREGYELDIERVLEHAHANGCFFEINSSPDRLDLSDEHAKMAKGLGIKIAINTDAHSAAELNFMVAGLNQARRGWLECPDVLNTLPLAKLKRTIRR